MTPLEHIMGLMDPAYSEPVRRSMAQSILVKHADELAEVIVNDTTATGEANDQYAVLHADLIKDHARKVD